MLTAGVVTQPSEFSLSFVKITTDSLTVGQVEGYGTVNLLKGEGRKRLYNTVGGFPAQKGIDNRVQGHTCPVNVIAAVLLLNVFFRHPKNRHRP
jgi:hypothetical protein